MFELATPTPAELSHVNLRTEKHGDDDEPAIDCKFTMSTTNEALAMFDPHLREALYCNHQAEQGQKLVDGVPAVLPNRRFPQLKPIAWDLELLNRKVTVGEAVELTNAKVNAFVIEPLEGGTVKITFSTQSGVPDGALDALKNRLQHEAPITVIGPKGDTFANPADNPFGSTDAAEAAKAGQAPKPTKGGKKGKDATDTFLEAQGATK